MQIFCWFALLSMRFCFRKSRVSLLVKNVKYYNYIFSINWQLFSFSFVLRLTFLLGEGIKLAVGVYALARTATKPAAVRLYRENNEPVHTKTRLYHTQNGSLLLPSDTKKSQVPHTKTEGKKTSFTSNGFFFMLLCLFLF